MCLGWMNRCQSGIAALRRQPMAFLPSASGEAMFPPDAHGSRVFEFPVDIETLEIQLTDFLRTLRVQALPHYAPGAPATAPKPPAPAPIIAPPAVAGGGGITAGLLQNFAWEYGRLRLPPSTHEMRFLPDGSIGGYDFPNERHWALVDGALEIRSEAGALTVRFTEVTESDGMIVLTAPYMPAPQLRITLRLARSAAAQPQP